MKEKCEWVFFSEHCRCRDGVG